MITKEDIKKLADLVRIEMDEDELAGMTNDFEKILEYISSLNKINQKQEDTTTSGHRNIFREDGDPHESGLHTKELLNEAPKKTREGYIRVPKIIQTD
ncbi:Asp-tRNA(Asn)/Glu-tRNA(Gln) amidotransferase GatCAB subunit C [bacterium]|nr:Asp-tRNA(Asn)/Glu-tRNA(Gln) amidotransferase GatCAB subunit C [bacterium]|tara:strand:+ start:1328 stop:1621 length:294 start_codon:yes stop_codon:yes gene_type:complete